MGAGFKKREIEVRSALFDFFIDVRHIFKARCIMLSKASKIYEEYCKLKKLAGEQPDQLKIQRILDPGYKIGVKNTEYPYAILTNNSPSLRKIESEESSNSYRMSEEQDIGSKSIITSINQSCPLMPLHHNESPNQKLLNFSGNDQSCFVKENHNLSRERATVMTIASSSNTTPRICLQRSRKTCQSEPTRNIYCPMEWERFASRSTCFEVYWFITKRA